MDSWWVQSVFVHEFALNVCSALSHNVIYTLPKKRDDPCRDLLPVLSIRLSDFRVIFDESFLVGFDNREHWILHLVEELETHLDRHLDRKANRDDRASDERDVRPEHESETYFD